MTFILNLTRNVPDKRKLLPESRFLKLSSDIHTYRQTDALEIIQHAASPLGPVADFCYYRCSLYFCRC